jgi:Domain of unknown function (DUF5666)
LTGPSGTVTVTTTDQTLYESATGSSATSSEVTVGSMIDVEGTKTGTSAYTATAIRLMPTRPTGAQGASGSSTGSSSSSRPAGAPSSGSGFGGGPGGGGPGGGGPGGGPGGGFGGF